MTVLCLSTFVVNFLPKLHNVTASTTDGYFTIIFDNADGTRTESKQVMPGDTIEKPNDPEKSGYSFIGWFNEFDFDAPINSDKTLNADWRPNATIIEFGCHHSAGCFPEPFEQETGKLPLQLIWPQDATTPARYVPDEPEFQFAGFHLGGTRIYDANGIRIGDVQISIPYDGAFMQLRPSWDIVPIISDPSIPTFTTPWIIGIIGMILLSATMMIILLKTKLSNRVPKHILTILKQ